MPNQPLKVRIVGIGGAGVSSLEKLLGEGTAAADIVAMNTDVQSLSASAAGQKLQIGRRVTRGLGAGGDPELGLAAAEEAADEIRALLRGAGMVFISAGLGGGTGSGAAPLVARIARELEAYVVVFATLPFQFEGRRRMTQALESLSVLRREAHAVVVFENDRMGERMNPDAGISQVFANADITLSQAMYAVANMTNREGLIQLGLDELFKAINRPDSRCLFGYGHSNSASRALDALENALQNPLMNRGALIENCRDLVVQVTGGDDMTLVEVQELMDSLGRLIGDDTQILFGLGAERDMENYVSVLLLGSVPEGDFQRRKDSPHAGEERQLRPAGRPVPQQSALPPERSQAALPPQSVRDEPRQQAPAIRVARPTRTEEPQPQEVRPEPRPAPREFIPLAKEDSEMDSPAPSRPIGTPAPRPSPAAQMDREPMNPPRPAEPISTAEDFLLERPETKTPPPPDPNEMQRPLPRPEPPSSGSAANPFAAPTPIGDRTRENTSEPPLGPKKTVATSALSALVRRFSQGPVEREKRTKEITQEEERAVNRGPARVYGPQDSTVSTGPMPGPTPAPAPQASNAAAPERRPEPAVTPRPIHHEGGHPAVGERPASAAPKQEVFQFDNVTRGRFEKSDPTIVDGEDLDVPTFMRRNQK